MQSGERVAERFFKFGYPFRLPFYRRLILRTGKRESRREFLQHVGFVGFVGVKFQTEIAHAEHIEPFFDNRQRRLFFGDEKHPFAVVQGVADDIRYRLTFTRSRRTVQNESLAEFGRFYRFPLRRVSPYRHKHFGRRSFVFGFFRRFVFLFG